MDTHEQDDSGRDISRLLPSLTAGELRALLTEVLDRLDGVITASEQLRRLLDAVVSISSGLDLSQVLRRIVESAMALTDAQYGAVGVLDQNDRTRLAEFVHVGIDAETVKAIGPFPRGRGVLGALINEPKPLRLEDIAQHAVSYGFPENHPPMKSFLGMPILVRGEVFGNLYLTEKQSAGEFTAVDQEVIAALAAAAGIAIDNARLYERTAQRERWLQASGDVTTRLLAGDSSTSVLELIVRNARTLAGADLAFMATANDDDTMDVAVADGQPAARLEGVHLPADSMSAQVLEIGGPVTVADARNDARIWRSSDGLSDLGPMLFVPLTSGQGAMGTLVVANVAGRPAFSPDVVSLVESFAAHAALAITMGEAVADRERLAVFEDRERIGRDLHDLVIQRLFASGMTLQSLTRRITEGRAREQVLGVVDDLDETIHQVRTTIFALQSTPEKEPGLRSRIVSTIDDHTDLLGFTPSLQISGLVETDVPDDVGEHMLAVIREALANVARHAQATRAEISIVVDGEVSVRVHDNGIGIGETSRRSGLRNLDQRARGLSGSCEVASRAEGGTALTWRVPLPEQHAD